MPTPYADFANCRLLFLRPTASVVSLREGPGVTTEPVVIEAMVKLLQGGEKLINTPDTQRASIIYPKQQPFIGWITKWAVAPSEADWLETGDAWTWTEGSTKPGKLRVTESEHRAWLGNLGALPDATGGQFGWMQLELVGSAYGFGGIGEILVQEAGVELRGYFRLGT